MEHNTCENKIKRLVRQYPNILVDNLMLKSRFLSLEIKTGIGTHVFSKLRPLFGERKLKLHKKFSAGTGRHRKKSC